ncbi:PH domain-containing protein [Natribaculum luteum]|uniref:PH domain-containing protein n=1 Tax=Natribaculum luteum TaxID=1586232 RepID=A0ABD5P6G7_9EURY|nr:PH domain-containing protein [Natribaculum luteum]
MSDGSTPDWLHLGEGEAVVWESRPHPVAMGSRLLVGVSLVLVGFLVAVWGAADGVGVVTAIGLVVAIVGAGLAVVRYVHWTTTRYVITTSELYEKRGVVSRDVTQFRLDRIQNTSLRQSALGRLLGYGNLTVYTAGSGDPELTFQRLSRPHEASTVLSEQLDDLEVRSST